jgi:non-specific serine/threonine protein kinase
VSAGLTISNRFLIADPEHDQLGRGGMGDVYRATDTQTGETVAVKALNPEVLARDPALLERFMREGEALRRLNHPNIVHSIAACEQDGRHYLVMEYVGGGSLEGLIRKEGRLPAARAVEIGLDLADALTRAHRLGIIHRDLKPANVLLAPDGTPRLADFGIAHMAAKPQLTQTGMLIGTVDYLSPEACQGEPLDERTDIWAFGVMLFQMLTGRLPFEGKSLTAKITAILTLPVPDLAELLPGLPDGLVDLIYRMLEKDRQQRIPILRLVGAELEALLKGRGENGRFAVGAQGLAPLRRGLESRFAPPPPAPEAPKHNLPVQATPFVGRQAELAELERLLADPNVRLVTIVGLGGTGKTRLALRAGENALTHFRDGVYLASLAPVVSPEGIVPAIAQATGLAFGQGSPPHDQLAQFLRQKHLLLILDNFEHLAEGATLVSELLGAAPETKTLVTSRTRLCLQGEHLFSLGGLDLPDDDLTGENALSSSAVQLFLQGARRVCPNFTPAPADLPHITRICRLVTGLPLGILLAAGWMGALHPAEVADEIVRNLDFLEADMRDAPARQRSLRAVFAHSWSLLAAREQRVFRDLAVFRSGFTREAAQTVTGASLRELMGLTEKSILSRDSTGRYGIHDLLLHYAEEKLLESEEAAEIGEKHLEYYSQMALQSDLELNPTQFDEWLHRMTMEHANLLSALEWSLASGRVLPGLRLATALRPFWLLYGLLAEGLGYLERFLAAARGPSLERARALDAACHLAYKAGDDQAARRMGEESLIMAESVGDAAVIADSMFRLAWPMFALKDWAAAWSLLERSRQLYEEQGRTRLAAWTVLVMGEVARAQGNLPEARKLHEESVALARRVGRKWFLATALSNLGCVLIHFGELERSEERLREGLDIDLELHIGPARLWGDLMAFSFLATARGQLAHAARLLSAADRMRREFAATVELGDRPDYEQTLTTLRARLGPAGFAAAWLEGEALTLEQAVALALEGPADDGDMRQ